MQKGKRRSKVQNPHNITQNKARAASSTCHEMRLEGYHIIKVNYPNSCLYHNFKSLNLILQV